MSYRITAPEASGTKCFTGRRRVKDWTSAFQLAFGWPFQDTKIDAWAFVTRLSSWSQYRRFAESGSGFLIRSIDVIFSYDSAPIVQSAAWRTH